MKSSTIVMVEPEVVLHNDDEDIADMVCSRRDRFADEDPYDKVMRNARNIVTKSSHKTTSAGVEFGIPIVDVETRKL